MHAQIPFRQDGGSAFLLPAVDLQMLHSQCPFLVFCVGSLYISLVAGLKKVLQVELPRRYLRSLQTPGPRSSLLGVPFPCRVVFLSSVLKVMWSLVVVNFPLGRP